MNEIKSSFQIAREAENFDGMENIKAINKAFLAQDTSEKWPINNRFNVTQKAINKLKYGVKKGYEQLYGLEYAIALDSTIGAIVNSQ